MDDEEKSGEGSERRANSEESLCEGPECHVTSAAGSLTQRGLSSSGLLYLRCVALAANMMHFAPIGMSRNVSSSTW